MALYFCALTSTAFIPARAVSSQGCTSIIYGLYSIGRRGKPRAIGRKGAQRRVRPLHQVRRSPIVKSVHWDNVLYVAMGECDRKPRLVVGGKLNLHGNAAHRANVTVP